MDRRIRKGGVGDVSTGAGSGWYALEWEFPRYEWDITEDRGEEFANWAADRVNEAMQFLDIEAEKYGVTIDEFLATMSYEIVTRQTDEERADGKPAFGKAKEVPLFNDHSQRFDLVAQELTSRFRAIGENEIAGLLTDNLLAKYDFRYWRIEKVTIRFMTEPLDSLVNEKKAIEDFGKAKAQRVEDRIEATEKNLEKKTRKRQREKRKVEHIKRSERSKRAAETRRRRFDSLTQEERNEILRIRTDAARKAAQTRAANRVARISSMTPEDKAAEFRRRSIAAKKGARTKRRNRKK